MQCAAQASCGDFGEPVKQVLGSWDIAGALTDWGKCLSPSRVVQMLENCSGLQFQWVDMRTVLSRKQPEKYSSGRRSLEEEEGQKGGDPSLTGVTGVLMAVTAGCWFPSLRWLGAPRSFDLYAWNNSETGRKREHPGMLVLPLHQGVSWMISRGLSQLSIFIYLA